MAPCFFYRGIMPPGGTFQRNKNTDHEYKME